MRKKTKKISVLMLATTLLAASLSFQSVSYAAIIPTVHTKLAEVYSLNSPNFGHPSTTATISSKLNTGSTDIVRVIVLFSNQPLAVGRYAAKQGINTFAAESTESAISSQQSSILNQAMSQGINLSVNYQFNTVLNGAEISIPANQIPLMAKIPGVTSIFENRTYYSIPEEPPAPTPADGAAGSTNFDLAPIQQIGAQNVWNMGFTGKGLKVGVIDTGVDYQHPDLKTAYKGGHDSFYNTNDPYEEQPLTAENDPLHLGGFAGTQHGTHVSGTIAGRAENSSEVVQKGIAYGADLYVYKVLGRNLQTGSASGSSAQVIDGIERAVKDGMDVINLSLGSDDEKNPNSPDSIAINNAVLSGVVAVIASGNAADKGHYYYSMGSPASAQLGISVGAVTSPSIQYSAAAAVTTSVYNATYSLNVMGYQTGRTDFASIVGTTTVDAFYAGLGSDAEYKGMDLTGKIAFVSRGLLAFVDKIKYAKAHNAKAIVIFNGVNLPGTSLPNLSESISGRDSYINSNLGDSFDYIPTFDMEGKAGRAIARKLVANPGSPLQFTFNSNSYSQAVDKGDLMAGFSSRGPEPDGNFSIKPDMSAPGVSIFSTWPAYGKFISGASYNHAYNRISGTSMATPHVAGAALLVKQAHPDWNPFDIRASLANTADEISDKSMTQYDVYSQGAGRINVTNAVYTPAVLEALDNITILDKNLNPQKVINYNDNVSFGLMAAGSAEKTENLLLKNTSNQNVKYTPTIVMHPKVTSDPGHPIPTPDVSTIQAAFADLDTDQTITVGPKSSRTFALKVKPKSNAIEGVYEGEIILTYTSGLSTPAPALHLPFVVHVGTQTPDTGLGVQDLILSNQIIGIRNKAVLSYNLKAANVNYIELQAFGLDDEYIGTLGKPVSLPNMQMITPGIMSFTDIDGSYDDIGSDGKHKFKYLPEGTYKLSVVAAQLDSQGIVVNDSNKNPIIYTGWSTLGVRFHDDLEKKLAVARDQMQTYVTNTTKIGTSVFTLPTTLGISYQVVASDNPAYISNNGTLLALPANGTAHVALTVALASTVDPSLVATAKVNADLFITTVKPYLLTSSSGVLDRTNGLTAKVTVSPNPAGGIVSGPAVVVFQLMNGMTPISIVAVSKSNMNSDEVQATFNVTGSNYTVNVFVTDSFDVSLTSVGTSLAQPIQLK